MQHAHTEVAVQALNAFQVIVIHPKYLQVDLHIVNLVIFAEDRAAGMPCLNRAIAEGSCRDFSEAGT